MCQLKNVVIHTFYILKQTGDIVIHGKFYAADIIVLMNMGCLYGNYAFLKGMYLKYIGRGYIESSWT